MNNQRLSRRQMIGRTAASGMLFPVLGAAQAGARAGENTGPTTSTPEDRERRMKWWHEARFGMFIHFGLYSVLGRHEWAMEEEGIPVDEYQKLAEQFNPKPHAARAWAKLATVWTRTSRATPRGADGAPAHLAAVIRRASSPRED